MNDVLNKDDSNKKSRPVWLVKLFLLLSVVGPGLITANIDNDAGGIATYSVAGAVTGYRLLWILLPITIALIMVQEMSSRMGIVTGKGLADLIREKYGLKTTFYTLIFLVMADLGNTMAEFAGIASAGEIFGISKFICVPISALFVTLLVFRGDYKIVERVFIAGCSVYFSYIITGFIIEPDWALVAHSMIVPDFSTLQKSDLPIVVGLIGTSITPWMQFYIQSAVVEKGTPVKHLFHSKIDVIVGCLFMFVVTLFIVICCASTMYGSGIQIHDAKDAALALKPLAGDYSSLLFGVGLFNASIFAAALLPLATSYYVCEGMGWESGVDKSFKEAPNFFSIFLTLVIVSSFLVLMPSINLLNIMIWSQVINGIFIPLVLMFIMRLCSDPDIMGEYTNSSFYNFWGYALILLMFVANMAMIYFEFVP